MVLEQEIASFELSSLELAGGLYASDTETTCAGTATLSLDGQMLGIVQAAFGCNGTTATNLRTQAIGTAVTACAGNAITSIGLQAYCATVAQSIGLSLVTYATGSYAATRVDGRGMSAGQFAAGAYAATSLEGPVGDFEVADFELCMSELGGELFRRGAAHADMFCVGQSFVAGALRAGAGATDYIRSEYVLPSGLMSNAGSEAQLKFSAYGDMRHSIAAESTATITAPNARLFRRLADSHDIAQRAREERGTIRPYEQRAANWS